MYIYITHAAVTAINLRSVNS